MKKKAIIISSVSLLVFAALIFASGIYINSHIDDITRKHLGAGIQFQNVDFSFKPLPAVQFRNLKIDKGQNKITIPTLVLYPDLMALLKGDVVVRKAVVTEPLILSEKISAPPEKSSSPPKPHVSSASPLTTAAIPAEMIQQIRVDGGKMLLKTSNSNLPPVTFAVSVDNIKKENQTISVQVKDFTIDEIGLNFAGDVAITSFSPLGLSVKASKAAINPTALKNFLVEFEFLNAELGHQLPAIEQVGAGELNLDIDPNTGQMHLVSKTLSFGENQLQNITLNLSKETGYELKCDKISMDIGTVQGWLNENPKGKEALEQLFVKAKLKDLRASGRIELSDINLKGGGPENRRPTGAMALKTDGLKIHLVAENGKEQNFTISKLETRITIEEGKPSLQVSNLQLASSGGGTGLLKGVVDIPVRMKKTRFEVALNAFQVFDTAINLKASKKSGDKLIFDMDLSGPTLNLLAKGQLQTPGREKTDFWIRMTECRISRGISTGEDRTPKAGSKPVHVKSEKKNFDFSAIQDRNLSGKAFVKKFQYNNMPQLNDVNLMINCGNNRAVLRGDMGLCQLDLQVSAVFTASGQVVAQIEGKSANMRLTPFVACFSRELPLFLTGKLTVMTSLFVQGQNTEALLDSAQGEIMVTLRDCTVRKVSNLDYRLGFLVDILKAADVTSLKDDAIYFEKGLAKANIEKGRMLLDRFSLSGPLLYAWGSGEFLVKQKRLKMAGHVRTAFGTSNALNIDRVFQKKET